VYKLDNKLASHLAVKQGVYYFVRRVPSDLVRYYRSTRVSYSLRTKSQRVANARARGATRVSIFSQIIFPREDISYFAFCSLSGLRSFFRKVALDFASLKPLLKESVNHIYASSGVSLARLVHLDWAQ
jgi:hypothetical protein